MNMLKLPVDGRILGFFPAHILAVAFSRASLSAPWTWDTAKWQLPVALGTCHQSCNDQCFICPSCQWEFFFFFFCDQMWKFAQVWEQLIQQQGLKWDTGGKKRGEEECHLLWKSASSRSNLKIFKVHCELSISSKLHGSGMWWGGFLLDTTVQLGEQCG